MQDRTGRLTDFDRACSITGKQGCLDIGDMPVRDGDFNLHVPETGCDVLTGVLPVLQGVRESGLWPSPNRHIRLERRCPRLPRWSMRAGFRDHGHGQFQITSELPPPARYQATLGITLGLTRQREVVVPMSTSQDAGPKTRVRC